MIDSYLFFGSFENYFLANSKKMPPKRCNQHAAPLSKCGEKLINEVIRLVQANSLLYDLSDANYRNGWVREKVYENINDELEVKKVCYLDGRFRLDIEFLGVLFFPVLFLYELFVTDYQ